MNSHLILPEVSLITSWYIPSKQEEKVEKGSWLPAMSIALQEGINLLDLYFLNHIDIPWYAKAAKRRPRNVSYEPHEFAASLTSVELTNIANELRKGLTECYGGRLVGRRPRFKALATFFPNISLPDEENVPKDKDGLGPRDNAVRALRNSVYLAHSLGCYCVEIVGGAGVPGPNYKGKVRPEDYRKLRRNALAGALCQVYDVTDDENPLCEIKDGRMPVLAMELEPGPSFLLRRPKDFAELRQEVMALSGGPNTLAYSSLRLNVDIAHAFLIGYRPEKLSCLGLADAVAHIHLSDHAGDPSIGGSHASDLIPGAFHFYYDDYMPWLRFAIEQVSYGKAFSGAIAIEMEACNDVSAVLCAVNTTRRWLRETHKEMLSEKTDEEPSQDAPTDGESLQMIQGVLLVIDIGNSTEVLLQGNSGLEGCLRIKSAIENLCAQVHVMGGSIMSFTGDGFIAMFEDFHFSVSQYAASSALVATEAVCGEVFNSANTGVDTDKQLTVRAALHWGQVHIPSSGRLRDQIIGGDVVIGARLCDWLQIIEEARPVRERGIAIAGTKAFYDLLSKTEQRNWTEWGEKDFKGLSGKICIYQRISKR